MLQMIQQVWERFAMRQPSEAAFARNVLWMGMGFSLRAGVQVVYFLLVARALQAAEYGIFAGSQALVLVFTSFTSWGSGNILIKYISRNKEQFPLYWGSAAATSMLLGGIAISFVSLLGWLIFSFETALRIILPMAIGDLLGLSFLTISGQAFQAHEQLSRTSLLWVLLSSSRLVMALTFSLLPVAKTAQNWAILYGVSGLLAGLTGLFWVCKELGWGSLTLEGMRGEWKEGFYFSISLSAQGVYNDIDKTLLARLDSATTAGAYAAAYRLLDAAYIPIRSILAASYPRFFRRGAEGLASSFCLALRLMPLSLGISALAWLVLALVSPYLPRVLGSGYALASLAVLWLGPILLFRAAHYLLADTLTGAGYQGLRSAAQVGVALLNFVLNLWLIPRYSWLGAVWSSLITDGGLMLILLGVILYLQRRQG